MAKSSFVDFKAVKAAITMDQVLEQYGLLDRFKRGNDSLNGPCPIHKGSNPTQFRVSISKNVWNCFSECKHGGNVLDFIAKMDNVSIHAAALKAIEWFSLDPEAMSANDGEDNPGQAAEDAPAAKPVVKRQAPQAEKDTPNTPLKFRLDKLERSHPYLAERGLTLETIVDFGLGFCSKGMMAERIAIPIHNAKGEVVAYLATFSGPSGTVTLTNCILANIINLWYSATNTFSVSGNYNGFYNCNTTFGSNTVPSSSNPFQTVGAGSYYLASGTPFQNAGTTNIDAALLTALQQKTTCPPFVYTNVTISLDTTLFPTAQRDSDTPDLGYHYDPIDYMVDVCAITNATLTVTNGAVITSFNDTGIWLQDGSSLVSVGTPLAPNWFTVYYAVQEQSVLLGASSLSQAIDINPYHYGSTGPGATLHFSKFSCPAGGGTHLFHTSSSQWTYNTLLVQDCELWGGANQLSGSTNAATATINNNLFYRSSITASKLGAMLSTLSLTNNLFYAEALIIKRSTNGAMWNVFDNAFDSCSIYSLNLTNGSNAFFNCSAQLSPTNASNIVLTNSLAYQAGPLGGFYQPSTSPLIDMGNVTADQVGLYHFTTQTNQTKETNSVVDIGYHYVALGTNGLPVSTGGDEIGDYLVDANGDGTHNGGDLGDWNSYTSPNNLASAPGLVVFTPLR